MTTNQTIDGVPRDYVLHLTPAAHSVMLGMVEHCLNIRACMGIDEGFKDLNTEEEHDFVKELRALLDADECCHEFVPFQANCTKCGIPYKPAAQPQGEPVEDCETFEYQLDMLGSIDRCNVFCGSYGDKYHQWDDAGPYVEYEDHVKHIELYKREIERLSKLYAEQPTPVAVTLNQVLAAYDYAETHPHKYLRGTTNWCAAVAHKLNACLDDLKRLNPSL